MRITSAIWRVIVRRVGTARTARMSRSGTMGFVTAAQRPALRLRGGGVFPFGLMRSYATWPLAVLEVVPGGVRLRCRLLSLMGGDDLDASPDEVAEVVPARGRFGASGVAFRLPDGRRFFFWTGQAEVALRALQAEGFPVGTGQQSEASW